MSAELSSAVSTTIKPSGCDTWAPRRVGAYGFDMWALKIAAGSHAELAVYRDFELIVGVLDGEHPPI